MELSPEIKKLPEAVQQFPAELVVGLLWSTLVSQKPRNFFEDAHNYLKKREINLQGIENIPEKGPGLIAFNHPQIPILIDGMIKLSYEIYNATRREDLSLVIGSEIPVLEWFGNGYLPGSPWLLSRLFNLYGEIVIPVPTKKSRKDYRAGRDDAFDSIINYLKQGRLVAYSPEARVELDNNIIDPSLLRKRSGEIAIIATASNIPQIPVRIKPGDKTSVVVGEPFFCQAKYPHEAAIEFMSQVGKL